MRCLSKEQITRLAVGPEEDAALVSHAEQCPACRASVSAMRSLTDRLAEAHGKFDRRHEQARARLLASLSSVEMPAQPVGVWNRLTFKFAGLTVGQRISVGGVGLSTVVGLVLLLLAWNSGKQLSAMERMAKQLCEVKSYSYGGGWKTTLVEKGKTAPTTFKGDGPVYWLAPDAFRDEMKIVKIEEAVPPGKQTEQLLEHFVQIFPAGKPGIFIDHTNKTFVRVRFIPTGSRTYPMDLLRMIRENSGKVTRDLGMKVIQGKKARGYAIVLKGFHEKRLNDLMRDAVEVWVDSQTDLPLEFGYEGKNEGSTYDDRYTNFRWNIELDPKLFDPTPPEGYDDITPPGDKKELDQIAEALKLYAELSRGHYPRVARFDGKAIRDEMRKMAGFTGPPQAEWNRDEKFQRIQQAAVGLDWIVRILRARHHAGYHGLKVGPADKDKVLLWWMVDDRYRVFYGDLRTEILSEAKAAKLALTEAASGAPADDETPNDNR